MTSQSQDASTSEAGAAEAAGATALLRRILVSLGVGSPAPAAADDGSGETAPDAVLGDVVNALDERAFGFMLLLLALPCCLPFVYVLPQIVALPMLALAGQLAAGRAHPWLPRRLAGRRFSTAMFLSVLDRSARYVAWFEALARPRLLFITGHTGARVVGALLLIPCASILVPLPGTNTAPGIGVAVASLGLIERDGALVLLGLAIGLAWVAILLIFGLEAASILKAWLAARI